MHCNLRPPDVSPVVRVSGSRFPASCFAARRRRLWVENRGQISSLHLQWRVEISKAVILWPRVVFPKQCRNVNNSDRSAYCVNVSSRSHLSPQRRSRSKYRWESGIRRKKERKNTASALTTFTQRRHSEDDFGISTRTVVFYLTQDMTIYQ